MTSVSNISKSIQNTLTGAFILQLTHFRPAFELLQASCLKQTKAHQHGPLLYFSLMNEFVVDLVKFKFCVLIYHLKKNKKLALKC